MWLLKQLDLDYDELPQKALSPLGLGAAPVLVDERPVPLVTGEETLDSVRGSDGKRYCLGDEVLGRVREAEIPGPVTRFQRVAGRAVVCPGDMVVDERATPVPSARIRISPPVPNKVEGLPPHPDEVITEEYSQDKLEDLLNDVRAAVSRPLSNWERWTKFRYVNGEVEVPFATVAFGAPPEEAMVTEHATAYPGYVQSVTVGARIRFAMRFTLPGRESPETAVDVLSIRSDGPDATDETVEWEKVLLPNLELRYSVVGPPLTTSEIQSFVGEPAPFLPGVEPDGQNPGPRAEPFWIAIKEYASRIGRCQHWDVLQVTVVPTDLLRTLQRPDVYVAPYFDASGNALVKSQLFSTAALRRPGLDALAAVQAGQGCEELGGIGRLTSYDDLIRTANGQRSVWPVMVQRGAVDCFASGSGEVTHVLNPKDLSQLTPVANVSEFPSNPDMPVGRRRLRGWSSALRSGTSPLGGTLKGAPLSPGRPHPGDRTVAAAVCFRLPFGKMAVAQEPRIVEQPSLKAQRPRASFAPGVGKAHLGAKPLTESEEDETVYEFVDNDWKVAVGEIKLAQELSSLLDLPTAEVVVGELSEKDGKIAVALLDREVSSALLSSKYTSAFEFLQSSLQDAAAKSIEKNNILVQGKETRELQRDLAPALQDLAAARARADKNEAELKSLGPRARIAPASDPENSHVVKILARLRAHLLDPDSDVNRNEQCLLHYCELAQQARDNDRVDPDLEDHLVVADLAAGMNDAAEKLLTLRV
jgi:hypothetical protein